VPHWVSASDPRSLAFFGTRNAYSRHQHAFVESPCKTKNLSVRTFLLLITSGILWITYGALASDWPVIATNAGMVVLNGAILGAKMRYQ
jgi:uncharacterized protein with PQ loop repeat